MDPVILGVVGVGALILLVTLGMSVAYAAGLVGMGGLTIALGPTAGFGIAGLVPQSETASFSLAVLPMFILIGYFAYNAGLTTAAFRAARAWLGWMQGGLAIATVFAAAAFGAVSGSSMAAAAVFSRLAIPEMLKSGFDRRLSAGVVAAAGTLAALIPPSGILVLYGVIVEESIGRLLIAGVIPGLISAAFYAGLVMIRVMLRPELAGPPEKASWSERFRSLPGVSPILMVILLLLGGIYSGWMTPTEAAAVGAFIVFLFALIRGATWAELKDSLIQTAKIAVMIFTIIWCVLIFVRFLGYAGLPKLIGDFAGGLPFPPLAVLLAILAIYFLLGMVMDPIGMLLLTLPLVHPIVVGLGYDSVWFAIILVKMCEIGVMTPPVGLNCFVVHGVRPDISLQDVFRGALPFVLADAAAVALFIAFPEIITFLPNSMFGA